MSWQFTIFGSRYRATCGCIFIYTAHHEVTAWLYLDTGYMFHAKAFPVIAEKTISGLLCFETFSRNYNLTANNLTQCLRSKWNSWCCCFSWCLSHVFHYRVICAFYTIFADRIPRVYLQRGLVHCPYQVLLLIYWFIQTRHQRPRGRMPACLPFSLH